MAPAPRQYISPQFRPGNQQLKWTSKLSLTIPTDRSYFQWHLVALKLKAQKHIHLEDIEKMKEAVTKILDTLTLAYFDGDLSEMTEMLQGNGTKVSILKDIIGLYFLN